MDLERPKLIDHRMSRVIPAVEACHIIRVLGEIIHHLALALITPLRSDYCCDWHYSSIMSLRARRAKQSPHQRGDCFVVSLLAMTLSVIWIANPIYFSGDRLISLSRVTSSTSSASTQSR